MSGLGAQIIVLAPDFNSQGVVEWGVQNIIPFILLVSVSASSPVLARAR